MTNTRLYNSWIKKGRSCSDVAVHLDHHLDEVDHLMLSHDPHRFAELVDLVILTKLYFEYSDVDFEKLRKERMKKFYSKLKGD